MNTYRSLFWVRLARRFLLAFITAVLMACGGGGSSSGDDGGTPPTTGSTISVTFVKGLVSGASCTLSQLNAGGAVSNEIATATTTAGVADFGDDIDYEGNALISCGGGTYTDEATGNSLAAPQMRAVVAISGDTNFVVSPLTEIATQLAGSDFGGALTGYNSLVETSFGITSTINLTIPTDLQTSSASNDAAGQYAMALALISQLNANDPGSSLDIMMSDLAADLDDGNLSSEALEELGQAIVDLNDSAVADNLSAAALNAIATNAGIPDVNPDPDPVADTPNILFIIADDLGLDSAAEYDFTMDPPTTPTLSALADSGVVFENVWAAPACAPTRAAIITGKHGVNNGVVTVPGDIQDEDETIFEFLRDNTDTEDYASAFFGKWHIGGNAAPSTDPVDNGVPYFAGTIQGNISDYNSWDLDIQSVDGTPTSSVSTDYNTTRLTELATNWIADQDAPWLTWLAYQAPHLPFHWPDQTLHTQGAEPAGGCDIAANRRDCYLAMIEAMDTEIGNLLDAMSEDVRENTIVIYVGDNGSPGQTSDDAVLPAGQSKGSLLEGGVRVPMIVSGLGVSRAGERETRLVTVTDIYATIAELAGSGVTSIYDSLSLVGYFSTGDGEHRSHAYSDYTVDTVEGWTVRNQTYQLLNQDGLETLYELSPDDLVASEVTDADALYELQVEGAEVRSELGQLSASPSGPDLDITDGTQNGIFSVRASTCARFMQAYTASATDQAGTLADTGDDTLYMSDVSISVENGSCVMTTNNVPNHDFQDLEPFANDFAPQDDTYNIPVAPAFADEITELSLNRLQGVFLNGVRIDVFAAACVGIGLPNEMTGCGNNPAVDPVWRFDPLFAESTFREDSHNAHTQPQGAYHYHGSPRALFDESGATESGVIGFAADGFPIFGSFILDEGLVREVTPSYQLRQGVRPPFDVGGSSAEYSEQPYDGTFRQDYEYVEGAGDLDECNGMTVDGIYGYYVTDDYPYILGCYRGTPDPSF